MRQASAVTALALILAAGLGSSAIAAPVTGDWGFDAAGMDKSVKPGDDFFAYANGGWDKATPIPADRLGWGVDAVIDTQAEARVREILEAPPAATPDAQKIHAAYQAFMDKARANALGAAPIAPALEAIRAVQTKADLAALMGRSPLGFQASIFDLDIAPDQKAPDRYAVAIRQGGLGLPGRDYYLEASFAAKKQAYQAYVAQMLALAKWPDPETSAKAVVDFETSIAEVSWTRAERRDPDKTYNPTTRAELQTAAPGFAWGPFLDAAGLQGVNRVIVRENTDPPPFRWTPMLALRSWRGVSDERYAPGFSGVFQARGGRSGGHERAVGWPCGDRAGSAREGAATMDDAVRGAGDGDTEAPQHASGGPVAV